MRFLQSRQVRWLGPLTLFLIITNFLGCASIPSQHTTRPSSSYVEVARVLDGDTFELSNRQKVRLLGVDAPETQHHQEGIRALGAASKQHLAKLLTGKTVRLERPVGSQDPYGRTLAYVYLTDGTLINRAMIEDGFAMPYTKYPCSKTSEFLEAAANARQERRGLWHETEFSRTERYEVRLSASGICHKPGNKGFERLKQYTAYHSLDACLSGGGRLPRGTRSRLG